MVTTAIRRQSAKVIVRYDQGILLVQRLGGKLWALPGGHVEPGSEPMSEAIRELKEETDLTARTMKHLFDIEMMIKNGSDWPMLKTFSVFIAKVDGIARPRTEIKALDYFNRDFDRELLVPSTEEILDARKLLRVA